MQLFYPTQLKKDYKVDSLYIDPAYYRNWGYWHTGWDINGKSGGNTDFGVPIYSVYDGVVTDAAQGRWNWGNIVRIRHAGLMVDTRYAHLSQMLVKPGDVVKRGQMIGKMGRGKNNVYTAHLHFDFMKIKETIPFDHWVFTKGTEGITEIKRYYLDPGAVFEKFGVE